MKQTGPSTCSHDRPRTSTTALLSREAGGRPGMKTVPAPSLQLPAVRRLQLENKSLSTSMVKTTTETRFLKIFHP